MTADRTPLSPLGTLVRRLVGHTSIYAAGAVLGLVLAMAQIAVLTRLLAPATFGRFAVLLFYSGLVTLVCNLGVVQGSLASGSSGGYSADDEFDAEDDRAPLARSGDDNRRRLMTGLLSVGVLAITVTALSAAAAPLIASVLLGDDRDAGAVVWATAAGALGSVWRLVSTLPRFERRPRTYVGLQVGRHLLIIGCAALLIEAGYGLAGALAGLATGKAIAVAIAIALSRHRFRLDASRQDALAIVRRGRPFVLISVTFFLSRNLDLYLLSRFVPSRDVAVYLVASRVGQISSIAVSAALFAWGPLVRGPLRVALERQRALEFARARLVTYYVGLATFAVVVITLLADVLVRVAPSSYSDAAALVPLLALAAAAHGALMVSYRMARFPQRTRALRRVGLLSLGVMAGAAAVLIPPLGGVGAALASVVAPMAAATAMLVLSQRGPDPLDLPWRRLSACVGLGAAVIAASFAARALPDGAQPIVDVILVLAFPALLLALRIVPREEVRRLVSLAGTVGAARRSDRQALPAQLGRLAPPELGLVEALLRDGEPLGRVAAGRHESPAETASALTAVLRGLGGIGEPSAADDRIGRYLLLRHTATHRDQEGHMIALDARVTPMDVDRLAVLAERLRSASADSWRRASTRTDVPVGS